MIERANHYLSSEPKMAQTAGGFGRFKKVLLLARDMSATDSLKRILEERAFDVSCCASISQALHQLTEMDVDVILCDLADLKRPCEMFYHAVEQFKPYLCRRFVFLSAPSPGMDRSDFIRQVRALMVWKPLQHSVLLETIGEILRKNEAGFTRENPA